MELALHIESIDQTEHMDSIADHLMHHCGLGVAGVKRLPAVNRIYIGDEFCPIRLPSEKALIRFCEFTQANKLDLTLLTPVLTDIWLDRCKFIFDILAGYDSKAEVVVNDFGTLHFLRRIYPLFRLSLGRLFNKGFKDPRLCMGQVSLTDQIRVLLSESTFDHPEFSSFLKEIKISRVERDLLPHAAYMPSETVDHDVSYYFPFGYVTTGRVCWTASLANNAIRDYKPLYQCSKPCRSESFELFNDATQTCIYQFGNTIFYKYSSIMIDTLVERADQCNDRLIYQGVLQ